MKYCATLFFLLGFIIIQSVGAQTTSSEDTQKLPVTGSELTSEAMGHNAFGMHMPQAPWLLTKIDAAEELLGREVNIVHWFGNWTYEFEAAPFENILASDRIPLFTWQAIHKPLDEIVSGIHDEYITHYALELSQFDEDVYIRLLPEMNGYWEPWNGDPETFITAWKHIVTLFRSTGAHNVKWVWAPNITDNPKTPENRLEVYYPGDDYVDVLGLSGYNWGIIQETTAWTSFEAIYAVPYERLTSLSDKPIWIAEIASAEKGGNKSKWISNMLKSNAFPKIEAFIWFNELKEADWRFNSSPEALRAFTTWHEQNLDVE